MSSPITPNIFTSPSGYGLIDARMLNNALAFPQLSSQDAITAHAGGGQTNAYQLTCYVNRVSTVATAADSVKLLSSNACRFVTIINDTATAMQVYGKTTATINNVATGTGISQPGNSVVTYYSVTPGKWFSEGGLESVGNFTTVNATTVNSTTFNAGADASAGTVALFPSTTASGKLILAAVNSAGAFNTTISNASMGQSTVVSIPDPGNATANFLLSKGTQSASGALTFTGGLTLSTAGLTITDVNVVLSATTGTKIGTATSQKLGFYNATPVIQQATAGTTTGFTAATGTAVLAGSTFTGNSGSTAYTIGDIVLALKTLGLMAA